MDSLTLEYLQEQYIKIQLLKKSEKSEVWLVYDTDGNLAVMKTIYNTGLPIKLLKDNPSRFWPKIHLLHEDKDQKYTLVIEEFIQGKTLEAFINDRKITPSKGVTLFKEFCRGLRDLHALGIIHRDIKPSNIVIKEDGSPVLVDFDSARLASSDRGKTSDTVLLGTKGYAPPEQFGYATTDVRSDIYALGVTFDKILPADSPFMLKKIVRKCRAFDPDNRYQNADEILRALSYARLIKILGGLLLLAIPALLLIKFVLFPMSAKPTEEQKHEQKYSSQQNEEQGQPAAKESGPTKEEKNQTSVETTHSTQQDEKKSSTAVKDAVTNKEEKSQSSVETTITEKPGSTESAVDNAEKSSESHSFKESGFDFIDMTASLRHNSPHRGTVADSEEILYSEYSTWASTPLESPIYREITFPDDYAAEVTFTNNSQTTTWENPEVQIIYGRLSDYEHRETRSFPDLPPGESYTLVYSLSGMKTDARFMYSGDSCIDIDFRPHINIPSGLKQTIKATSLRIHFLKDIPPY